MSRAIRLRLTRAPSPASTAWTRGLPYVDRLRWWIFTMRWLSFSSALMRFDTSRVRNL
jgi:hypothetical protein